MPKYKMRGKIMIEKRKSIFKIIYISIIVPIIILFLIPILYGHYLNNFGKRYYYTNQCNWILIVISILLIISTYFISSKNQKDIIYYTMGITMGIISIIVQQKEIYLYLQTFIQNCMLIAGYIALILFLILSSEYAIIKRDKNIIQKKNGKR